MIPNHLETLNKLLELHSSKYEKMLILGVFNLEIDENLLPHIKSSYETYYLTNLIKQPTCYNNPHISTCIEQIKQI